MPHFDTSTIRADSGLLPEQRQIYNGLDCMLTLEIFEEISKTNRDLTSYNFSRALQGPILEIMLRGFRVDRSARILATQKLRAREAALRAQLDAFAHAIWGKPLNPRSTMQLQEFFYKWMNIPEIWISQKGERKLSMNREVLEKLDLYLLARPIVGTILAIRSCAKQIEVLETEISPDGRMRTSYNIGGTETGRLSSSASADGTGSNLQNIEPGLRYIFTCDDDMELCVIDLEQAESREVGLKVGVLFDDWAYLDACEGGDLHTTTCKLIWEKRPWTGDPKADKTLAEEIFYRHYSYRDMSKRGGHSSNYYGQAHTTARHLKVPAQLIVEFQQKYFTAFPGIRLWHQWVAQQIQTTQTLTTFWGRERQFFGRPNDDTTLREAIAFEPQSCTADRTNFGLLRIWQDLGKSVQLLAQTHDSVTFQYPKRLRDEVVPQAVRLMEIPITVKGRTMIVPGEAKIGYNWGYQRVDKATGKILNPNGLRKYRPGMTMERVPLLDLPIE